MHILPDSRDPRLQRGGVELGPAPRQRHQLRAARIEGWRAAFVDFDMRFLVAEDSLPRPHEMREDDAVRRGSGGDPHRSEEHTSELQSLMRISYAVFCLKKKKKKKRITTYKINKQAPDQNKYTQHS